MRKAKLTALTMIAVTGMVALAGCSSGAASPGESGADGGGDTVKIGAWTTTTGPIAVSGVPVFKGASAAFEAINAKGGCNGHQIEYITADNAYDPQQTLQVAKKLVEEDGIVALVAAYGTLTGGAALPYLVESNIPFVNNAGTLRSWFEPPQDGVYGVEAIFEDQGAALGQWAADDGAEKIVVVHSDPDAFVSIANQVGPAATEVNPDAETTLVSVKYHSTDYSPVVQQVKALEPDAVVLVLGPDEAALYLQQAKLQSVGADNYGYAPTSSNALITLAGESAEGYKAVSWVRSPQADTPELQAYRDAMEEYASDQPIDNDTLRGYGLATTFCDVISTIEGDVTPESIIEAYNSTSDLETGIYAPLTFSAEDHMGTRSLIQVEVEDGEWTELTGEFFTPPTLK